MNVVFNLYIGFFISRTLSFSKKTGKSFKFPGIPADIFNLTYIIPLPDSIYLNEIWHKDYLRNCD